MGDRKTDLEIGYEFLPSASRTWFVKALLSPSNELLGYFRASAARTLCVFVSLVQAFDRYNLRTRLRAACRLFRSSSRTSRDAVRKCRASGRLQRRLDPRAIRLSPGRSYLPCAIRARRLRLPIAARQQSAF